MRVKLVIKCTHRRVITFCNPGPCIPWATLLRMGSALPGHSSVIFSRSGARVKDRGAAWVSCEPLKCHNLHRWSYLGGQWVSWWWPLFTGLIVNIDIAVRSAALQQWLNLQIGNSRQRGGGTINSSHILILTSIKTLGILNRQIIQFSKQLLANQTYFFIQRLSVC